MNAPLVVIGIDAGDPEWIETWMSQGHLPNLKSICDRGVSARTAGADLISEHTTWVTLLSGTSLSQHGFYFLRQLRAGTYDLELVNGFEAGAAPFWSALSGSDCRVTVIDAPHARLVPDLPGVQITDWASHQNQDLVRHCPRSQPEELLRELTQRYPARLRVVEEIGSSPECDLEHYRTLLQHVKIKANLCSELLNEQPSDLAVLVFSEAHSAGHQFWRYCQEAPATAECADARLRDATRSVYSAIDEQIGRLLQLVPDRSNVCVVSSVGLVDAHPIGDLPDVVLRRLGYQATPTATSGWRPLDLARKWVPESARERVSQRIFSRELRESLLASAFRRNTDWTRTRAFSLPSFYSGFIRVNLAGREPLGIVRPGREYESLVAELQQVFLSLRDPETDGDVVEEVVSSRELFGEDHHPSLPDLFVKWAPGRPATSALMDDQLLRATKNTFPRISDHSQQGFFAAAGPSIAPLDSVNPIQVLDLAPTFLHLLHREPLPAMQGRPLWSSR